MVVFRICPALEKYWIIRIKMKKTQRMIEAVKACLGTPFHHQGRIPLIGLDCIGLVIVGLKAIGWPVQDQKDYAMRPDGKSLIRALEQHGAKKVEKTKAGDVFVFRYDNQPQHVAIALSEDELIHAFAPAGGVVRSKIGSYWKRRMVARYRFDLEKE